MLELTLVLTDEQVDQIAVRVVSLLAARTAPPDDGYLDTTAAAKYLCCNAGRIHDLVQLHKLTPLRDGRRLLFKRQDLDDYLNNNMRDDDQ